MDSPPNPFDPEPNQRDINPSHLSYSRMIDFWAFTSAVVGHWLTIMTGIVSIVVGLLQYWTSKRFLPSVWIAVGVMILFIASYQAWSEERAAHMAERCKIEKFERRSTAKNTLASFMDGIDVILNAGPTKDTLPDQVNLWYEGGNVYINKLKAWVKDNLGPAALTKASGITNLPPISWNNAISPTHNTAINLLMKYKANLNDLIGSSLWDDFDVRVASSIDACTKYLQ